MDSILEVIRQPWPWYVAGPIITLVMFLLLYFGKTFGISANFRTMCSMAGAGKKIAFFNFSWRKEIWNLVFAAGLIVGGFISHEFLDDNQPIILSEATTQNLIELGVETSGELVPMDIFSFESLMSVRGIIMLVVGGFLVGFGGRYAGGCTSGHAISGLSDLQPASLLAVIGFFIGGLFATYFILPYLLTL
jgi:uncharacterized membrane protein YedE/YeeE